MGIQVTIGDYHFEAQSYEVREEATPLAAGDSMGAVSTMSITIARPDPHLPIDRDDTGAAFIRKFGPELLRGLKVTLQDSRKGFITGMVDDVEASDRDGMIRLTCLSALGDLAIYNVQALPYVGTLGGAFAYYLSLAGVTDIDRFRVDESITGRPVAYVGWFGELWYNLKLMAAAEDCEITLVSGIIVLRPVRTRRVTQGRTVEVSRSTGTGAYARAVEVYNYNTSPVFNSLVYPPNGPGHGVDVLTVGAGELVEHVIDLGASVSSLIPPVMVTEMGQYQSDISAYMVLNDDGELITPEQWEAGGGYVEVGINEDTISATVRIRGPQLVRGDGQPARSYSLAMTVDEQEFAALRILGDGVRFSRSKTVYHSGITPSEAGTEISVTVDNPFVSSVSQAANFGLRGALAAARLVPTLSGSLISVSRRGDSGAIDTPTYAQVRGELEEALGSPELTWSDVEAYYNSLGLYTYGDVQNYYQQRQADSFEEQVYGNVQGARYWDSRSRRYYRVRTADIGPGPISFTAESDVTVQDMQELYAGMTYADIQELFDGLTYRQAGELGMYRG